MAAACHNPYLFLRAVYHCVPADAASRRRDRGDFESRFQLDGLLDLDCGAAELHRWAAFRRNAISLTNAIDGDALEGHRVLV